MIVFIFMPIPLPIFYHLNQLLNSPKSWNDLLNRVASYRELFQKPLAEVTHFDVVKAAKSNDVVSVKHTLFHQKDDQWYKNEDSFLVPPEIFPAHIRDKILGFDGEVDITEEIDSELAARIKLLPSPSNKNFKE